MELLVDTDLNHGKTSVFFAFFTNNCSDADDLRYDFVCQLLPPVMI